MSHFVQEMGTKKDAFNHALVAAPYLSLSKNCGEISCFFAVLALIF